MPVRLRFLQSRFLQSHYTVCTEIPTCQAAIAKTRGIRRMAAAKSSRRLEKLIFSAANFVLFL
jgi:sulfite reductase beta subunit-like hemoprotein